MRAEPRRASQSPRGLAPRWRLRWALACVCLAGACALKVQAQPDDRAQEAFQRPGTPATRAAPLTRLQWEQALRGNDRMPPAAPRALDAALLASARAGRWSEVSALLKRGASANSRDDAGGHALVLAARSGQDAVLRELLQRGADRERLGEDGFNALGAAAFAGHRSSVRLLLAAGVDPARQGSAGQTALHLAAAAGHVAVVALMLERGIDKELLNRSRETALDVAAAAGQDGVMDLLIQGGADLARAGRR